jgi:hypothetical protein
MSATSDTRAAADVLAALLDATPPPTGRMGNLRHREDARIRGALRAAQRALTEAGVRELDAMADERGSEKLRAAAAGVGQDRALRAVERFYSRQP